MHVYGDYGFDDYLEEGGVESKKFKRLTSLLLEEAEADGLEYPLEYNCAAFSAQNSEGSYVFGRNWDYYSHPHLLYRSKPDDGYASIAMATLTFLKPGQDTLSLREKELLLDAPYRPTDGLNDQGLFIGVMALFIQGTTPVPSKTSIHINQAIRLVLDKAKNVEEALELLEQYNLDFGTGKIMDFNLSSHFLIADASGNSVVVEYMTDGVAIVEKSGSWQLSTNFPLSSWDGDLSNMPDWRWRYPIGAAELERKNGVISRDNAMGILASIAQEKTEVMPWETVFSVVYTPEGSVDIVMNREWSTVHRFHINSL